jgi:hypothetical protein
MRASWLVGLLVVAAVSPLANAYITGIACEADGDGAITCSSTWEYTNTEMTEANLNITETMYRSGGHVQGDVFTDTEEDPIVWILKTVENATNDTWTGYHFNIFMDKSFEIVSAMTMPGWTFTVTPASAGAYTDIDGRPWGFWGAVDYVSTGSSYDIAPGGFGDFGARISFLGTVQFEVEQMYVVPEPISMALLALGGLFLRRRN